MILESLLFRNMRFRENFEDDNETLKKIGVTALTFLIIVLVIAVLYTFGAVSLSMNYNDYRGTSSGFKTLYAILVFLFPSLYYPFYALVLNPIKTYKSR